jgi:HSP90 family molecular chaperone
MSKTANFSVDPRLASILGENYSSSERALRELVDNSWDAEATVVKITLPDILNESPIIVADNGSGMKKQELRREYLNIASPRNTRKGEKTPNLQRTVKGRRGIGKFAGLILASQMEGDTKAHGMRTRLTISKDSLLSAGKDIEQVALPIETNPCNKADKGTSITLTNLNQNLNFPKAEKLKEIIAYDYGREADFEVYINGETNALSFLPSRYCCCQDTIGMVIEATQPKTVERMKDWKRAKCGGGWTKSAATWNSESNAQYFAFA